MKIPLPKGKYLKKIEVNEDFLDIEFEKRKKVALLFVCLNANYWPYIAQVIQDCRKNFLPQHHVDYFVWTDYNEEGKQALLTSWETAYKSLTGATPETLNVQLNTFFSAFTQLIRQFEPFYADRLQKAFTELYQLGIAFKREGPQFRVESTRALGESDYFAFYQIGLALLTQSQMDIEAAFKEVTLIETGGADWPGPTLMRYHLFLNQEEKLKDYDYLFYLDADMRVVSKVSDEILGKGLTAAPHPGYELDSKFIPPYEPNPDSTAYIHRLGRLVDENGKKRFRPFYAAGGFQGGVTKEFIKAMKLMKKNIDVDFDHNYTAIWNDESHWNKYLWNYKGDVIFLDQSYVMPDSLIKEYYEPLWGKSIEPKIITLTKPFSLSSQGADELAKLIK